jgi:hypothetical protein
MMGGDLPTLDEFSLKLITHKDILECNQNGVMGSLVYEADNIEIWKSIKKGSEDGWIGIFNRSAENKSISLRPENLGLNSDTSSKLFDVWSNKDASDLKFEINPDGVVFLKY